ncbi:thioredoxin-dependent thiol peroxidase [[Clostridium] leptum]|uniref:thioredoxin-dependent peroxiredoxin n=1 Tax=Solibaculum mannosilyticum TaxID=2780922 RepID=A0A7I8D293_9FIRM|nr:thioredoxin-dependent thiol peroxidase [Solibaculum mannosilyticum]MCO7137401.1 thioredoxin-dependent thiol peroxidase [[Clostridium] leptum]BCI59549.1 peroxiredoxin [Solibaculum mannosilyticum]
MLKPGEKAPDFTLPDQNGQPVSLSSFLGKTVILYFYPRDNTPGCTKEACSFRDHYPLYTEKDAVIIGISPNTSESHQKFAEKYELPFLLLADPEKEVIQAYGAWGEKKNYGKVTVGLLRSTFVIGPDGVIQKVFKKVKTATHGEDVLKVLSAE